MQAILSINAEAAIAGVVESLERYERLCFCRITAVGSISAYELIDSRKPLKARMPFMERV
jgi:hypothetical protein